MISQCLPIHRKTAQSLDPRVITFDFKPSAALPWMWVHLNACKSETQGTVRSLHRLTNGLIEAQSDDSNHLIGPQCNSYICTWKVFLTLGPSITWSTNPTGDREIVQCHSDLHAFKWASPSQPILLLESSMKCQRNMQGSMHAPFSSDSASASSERANMQSNGRYIGPK